MAASSPGRTAAKIRTPFRRFWNIRKDFWSATPPASAMIPTASPASWAIKATLVNIGGEGSQRWKIVEEKGTHERNPFLRRPQKLIRLGAAERHAMSWSQKLLSGAVEKTYGALPFISDSNPSHMRNWLECLRTRNQPNANVERGLAQSAAVIMAARAQQEGKKLYWNAQEREIVERAPADSTSERRPPSNPRA